MILVKAFVRICNYDQTYDIPCLLQTSFKHFNDMDNPLKFTKDDVRSHLAEQGYSNIQGNQLDEFCEDLKRLIKYEEKKQNIGRKLDQLDQMERNLSANKENEEGTNEFTSKVIQFTSYFFFL